MFPWFTTDAPGQYLLSLTVDNGLQTDTSFVTIAINGNNSAGHPLFASLDQFTVDLGMRARYYFNVSPELSSKSGVVVTLESDSPSVVLSVRSPTYLVPGSDRTYTEIAALAPGSAKIIVNVAGYSPFVLATITVRQH